MSMRIIQCARQNSGEYDDIFKAMDDIRTKPQYINDDPFRAKINEYLVRKKIDKKNLIISIGVDHEKSIYRAFDANKAGSYPRSNLLIMLCICLCQSIDEARELLLWAGHPIASLPYPAHTESVLTIVCPLRVSIDEKLYITKEYFKKSKITL